MTAFREGAESQPEAQGETPRTDAALVDYVVAYDEGGRLIALARQLERELAAAKRGVVGEPLAYMNKDGQVISAVEYHKDYGAFAWVIEKHWTPVTPLYAAAPQQNAAPSGDVAPKVGGTMQPCPEPAGAAPLTKAE